MADALVSTPVAATAGAIAVALIGIATKKVSLIRRDDIIPLMGVMGAFVFAAQMLNFTIPGTGSSGHIIGGILLAALMGPWAGFLTLCTVLIIQCLIFADGGLLALGCNIINMAAMSCLVAYPLLYRPLANNSSTLPRIMGASILSCAIGLVMGSVLVTVETLLSGVTALPFREFIFLMVPIHLIIGVCEGVATGAVLDFVASKRRDLLYNPSSSTGKVKHSDIKKGGKALIGIFFIAALVMGSIFFLIASDKPDGLEWSITNLTGSPELEESIEPSTAVLAGYDSTLSGIIGALIVLVLLWGLSKLLFKKIGKKS